MDEIEKRVYISILDIYQAMYCANGQKPRELMLITTIPQLTNGSVN